MTRDVEKEKTILLPGSTPVIQTEPHIVEKPDDSMPEIPQCDSSQTGVEDASANAADASLIKETTQLPESSISGETNEQRELRKGDWVRVKDLTEEEFRRLQDAHHGGFVSDMLQVRATICFAFSNGLQLVT